MAVKADKKGRNDLEPNLTMKMRSLRRLRVAVLECYPCSEAYPTSCLLADVDMHTFHALMYPC